MTRRDAIFLPALMSIPAFSQSPAPAEDLLHDKIHLKLANDAVVQGGAIEVEIKQGVVTLKGKVRSDKAKEKATKLTKQFKGVKTVDNQLVVSKF